MSDYRPTTQEVRTSYGAAVTFPTMSLPERRRAFDRWLEQVKAEAWEEGYRQGIEDERTAEALQVNIGLGGYATPNRTNPYRQETQA